MEKNKKAVDIYRGLELNEQFIVAECMRFIKPVDYHDINSVPSDIYNLPEHKLELIITILEILKTYGKINGINNIDREKLIEFAKLGSHFLIMKLKC